MTPRRALDYRVDPFDLQLFMAVLEHGTITSAAEAMNLSLAAASARLKALEHRVGAALLLRSKAGAQPSDAGRALARQARRVLAEIDALHAEMASFGHGLRGTIRLSCNTAAATELVPPRLARHLSRHPDIDVQLQDLSSDAVLEGLRNGSADLGIVADHVDTDGLDTLPWLPDELVALLPATARSPGRTTSLARLLDRPFVGLGATRGLSRFLLQQAARCGRVPHHRVRVSSFDAVGQMVAAGVGVGVVPLSAAQRMDGTGVRVVRLSDPWARRRLVLCCTSTSRARPEVRSLIESLLAPL